MRQILCFVFMVVVGITTLHAGQIKLLAIGNSFSEDALEQYLYELADAGGDDIIIGNLYIGGSSLAQHYNNSVMSSTQYAYRKIVNGVKTESGSYTLKKGITDEDWDYISFQQASPNSGQYNTFFPALTKLLEFTEPLATNPNVEFILHRTWAYAKNSTHDGFNNYGKDQMTMFNAIVDAYDRVAETAEISIIIPAGTAIQNGRTSVLGDSFCRDGYHLELTYGRFTVACTWYEKLFGKDVTKNPYAPPLVSPFQAQIAKYAAHYAVEEPNTITSLADLEDETPTVPFTKTINLSFAGTPTAGWNVLADYNLNAGIDKLRDIAGDYTDVTVKITDRFGGVNSDGPTSTNTSMNMPAGATRNSFFGNTADFGGFEPTAAVKFYGLDPDQTYDFQIFAGRMNVSDNRETAYRFDGLNNSDTIVYLNASNNSTKIVEAYSIAPNSNGEIELKMKPGPNNTNGTGFYYIAALSITPKGGTTELPTTPFSSKINLSFVSSSGDPTWNLLADYNEGANVKHLVDEDGELTDASVHITKRFRGINSNGPTVSSTNLNMPAAVSVQSFHGNTALWDGLAVPTSAFKFSSLNPAKTYDFEIFASRMDASDNREAYYTFSGAVPNDTTLFLNASNNTDKTVLALGIKPDDAGEILIDVGPGPNNNNNNGFFYITAMSIAVTEYTGLTETFLLEKFLYPNPCVNELNVYVNNKSDPIRIYGVEGKELMFVTNVTARDFHKLDVSDLLPGTYIVNVGSKSSKLIKH